MGEYLDDFIAAYNDSFDYAFDNFIILNWYPQKIIDSCQADGSMHELDLGYGLGTSRFSKHLSRHVVIDASESVIEQFKRQDPDSTAEVLQACFEDFHSDERFDVIVMGLILEHVADSLLVLKMFRMYLAQGGRCFVAVSDGESPHRHFGHAAAVLPDMMYSGKGDLELGHLRLYSMGALARDMNAAQHRVTRKEGLFFKPFVASRLQSLNLERPILRATCSEGIDYLELSCAVAFEAAPTA